MTRRGVLSEASVKQELLNNGLDPRFATNAAKAQARLNIIMRGTTAAQGDAIRTGGSFANQMKALQAVFEDTKAEVGAALLPVVTKLVSVFNELFNPVAEIIKQHQQLVVVAAASGVALVGAGAAMLAFGISAKIAAAGIGVMTAAIGVVKTIFGVVSTSITAFRTVTVGLATVMQSLFTASVGASAVAVGTLGVTSAGASAALLALTGSTIASGTAAAGASGGYGFLTAAIVSAGTAAAAAWAAIVTPALPFIAVAGAVVGAVTAIAGSAALAAARGIEFGQAWEGIKTVLTRAMAIAKEVGSVLMAALSAGEYEAAAQALWLGVQIAFWEGAQGAVNAFAWMFSQAMKMAKRFFRELIDMTVSVMKFVAEAIQNPASTTFGAVSAIKAMLDGTTIDFSIEGNADAAREELAALMEQLEGKAKADGDADAIEKETAAINAKITAIEQGEEAAQRANLKQQGFTDEQIEGLLELQREHEELVAKQEATEKAAEAFDNVTESIREQIIELREGTDALQRHKLEQLGLNDAQIASVEAMRAQQKQLEAMRSKSEKRVEKIVEGGDRMLQQGASPKAIAEQEKKWIEQAQAAGRIDKQTAEEATAGIGDRMQERMEKLREEARQLKEELRTPEQVFSDRRQKINQLQGAGQINGGQAAVALEKAREEMRQMLDRGKRGEVTGERQSVGQRASIATTSAHAAVAMGQGGGPGRDTPDLLRRQLVKTDKQNDLLQRILHETKNGRLHHA